MQEFFLILNIMKATITLMFIMFFGVVQCQEKAFITQDIKINSLIEGTLYMPKKITKSTKLVILIAGSGPTNRSGNQVGMTNNSLKYLSQGLSENGIATFSYDKRIFALLKAGKMDESNLKFEDMITDTEAVIDYFKNEKKFKKIIIAGHSEGSLVGMVAAKNKNIDAFISLSGSGRSIDELLLEQISKQMPQNKEICKQYLDTLKMGKTFKMNNTELQTIFRKSVQPYLISWIKYNPQIEISKLKIPVLIVNGTKDIQVPESEAVLLHNALPSSKLSMITNMNHVFKIILKDDENIQSYSKPEIPVSTELIKIVANFIKDI